MIIKAERERLLRIKSNCNNDDGTLSSTDLDTQTQSEYNYDININNDPSDLSHTRKLLYYLSKNHLEGQDWKRLARFWDFTEDQIKGKLMTNMSLFVNLINFCASYSNRTSVHRQSKLQRSRVSNVTHLVTRPSALKESVERAVRCSDLH